MSLATMLPSLCTLQNKTSTNDSSGGMVNTFADAPGGTDIPCDIQPAQGSVRIQYMQNQLNVTHTIFTEEDIGAVAGDIIISEGRTFQFQGKEQPAPNRFQWPGVAHVEEQLG